ncbi:hypothetical protein CJD36_002120 [Flavipsychrobacter stenotrophus]|uniref:Uncharacterized protein n=1 Tax=Flavipsychrobacter stenotrophus TaxID=2077091 RepID=A0A2S7T0S6_9BACT|nr:hypothetical protein CJD36_002120 [Flavipsychrobacter stenotrophus]
MTRSQEQALKGRKITAEGEALGKLAHKTQSPEAAKQLSWGNPVKHLHHIIAPLGSKRFIASKIFF